jgi:CheY-like chemotaxis protein
MDGMTATRAIRALESPAAATPVIALTANVLPEQIEAYRTAGMDGHIGKPFHRDRLLNAVSLLLPAGSTAKDASHPGLDREMFQAMRQALPPPRLREVLGIFLTELESSFDGDSSDASSRTYQRQRAHALRPSAATIGFRVLSLACSEVETFDEGRIEREGLEAYVATITKIRRLSADARDTVRSLIALARSL